MVKDSLWLLLFYDDDGDHLGSEVVFFNSLVYYVHINLMRLVVYYLSLVYILFLIYAISLLGPWNQPYEQNEILMLITFYYLGLICDEAVKSSSLWEVYWTHCSNWSGAFVRFYAYDSWIIWSQLAGVCFD